MERIVYRKTLDVHKNGIQFLLQGFETADKMSRVIEISLMASGDAIDFPLERIVAMMYVTSPGADEPSINKCTIVDNKVVYEVLPITTEGITEMQIKLIETSPEGAKSVLASAKFAVEVYDSGMNDDGEELKATFTAIEEFIAKAEVAYGKRLERVELTSDCIFKAYYADATYYETDVLKRLFMNGNVLLSESFAHGNTGVRAGEDTDNSMYYSNVARSEALNAKNIMENSEELLEEVKLHGMYTAFSIDFTTGEVEYVSPSFKFNINKETGELDAIGQAYSFNDEIGRVVTEWLGEKGVVFADLQAISSTHSQEIAELGNKTQKNEAAISTHSEQIKTLDERVAPINKGGTGATTAEAARTNLGVPNVISKSVSSALDWNLDRNVKSIIDDNSVNLWVKTGDIHVANVGGSGVSSSASSILMINNGKIRLCFGNGSKLNGDDADEDMIACSLTIKKNGNVIWNVDTSHIERDISKFADFYEIDVQVEKGDVLYFEAYAEGYNTGAYIGFGVIDIKANIETPFTYTSLINSKYRG